MRLRGSSGCRSVLRRTNDDVRKEYEMKVGGGLQGQNYPIAAGRAHM